MLIENVLEEAVIIVAVRVISVVFLLVLVLIVGHILERIPVLAHVLGSIFLVFVLGCCWSFWFSVSIHFFLQNGPSAACVLVYSVTYEGLVVHSLFNLPSQSKYDCISVVESGYLL